MTKPNNFIANSDYLSLAQKSNTEFTVVFPSETFQPGMYNRHHDFTLPAIHGAIDEIIFSYNGSDYMLGNSITVEANPPSLHIFIFRVDPSTIRVMLHTFTNSTWTMPTQTLNIRVSSFLPPNVF